MTQKQIAFLQAMLEESTVLKASERAGISRSTAYKYLADENFTKELNKRRNEAITDTVRYLQGKLGLCSEELIKIIEDELSAPQVKINAINAVFANCKALTDTGEVLERMQRIEEMMEARDNEEWQ